MKNNITEFVFILDRSGSMSGLESDTIGGFLAERGMALSLLHAAVRLPSAAFFAITIVGMIAMVVCAKKFDRFDVRGNWIEQGINAAAQGCALIGVLLL